MSALRKAWGWWPSPLIASVLFMVLGYTGLTWGQGGNFPPSSGSSTIAIPATVTGGTSGGIACFDSATDLNTSGALASTALVVGGGAGACPGTGNGDFTYATHTLTAGASGLVDLSAISGANGFKIPNQNGCTAGVAADFCYDSAHGNNHVFVGGQGDNIIVPVAAVPATNCIFKNLHGSTAQEGCSAIIDAGTNVLSSEPIGPTDGSFGSNFLETATGCETAFGATTLATGATTTQTGQNCLPASSIIDGVVARVTTTITAACTGWEFGDGTTATRFTTNNTNLTAGSTAVPLSGSAWSTGIASATTGIFQQNAAKITITCAGGNPGAGAIRIIVYSHAFTNPTS